MALFVFIPKSREKKLNIKIRFDKSIELHSIVVVKI